MDKRTKSVEQKNSALINKLTTVIEQNSSLRTTIEASEARREKEEQRLNQIVDRVAGLDERMKATEQKNDTLMNKLTTVIEQTSSLRTTIEASEARREKEGKHVAFVPDIASPPVGSLGSPVQSDVNPYLTEGTLLLRTCWKTLHDITGLKLRMKQKLSEYIILAPQQWENICSFVYFLPILQELKHDKSSGSPVRTIEEALSFLALGSAYNHQMITILVKEEKSARTDQDNMIDAETVKKLTLLKTSLEMLTTVVDKIMNFYSLTSLGFAGTDRPLLDNLEEMKEMMIDLKSIMKDKELHFLSTEYYQCFQTTEENIMCDILGMRENVGKYLCDLDLEIRSHQSDHYFLEKFVENRENDLCAEGSIDQTPGKIGLLKNLEKLGFTTDRASIICESIPDDFIDLQSPSFWALRYLDHATSRHPLFSSAPRYPYQEGNTDNFFLQIFPTEGRPEPVTSRAFGQPEWSVNILNVSGLDRQEITAKISELLREEGEANNFNLFYHGTSYESAKSILESGIKLRRGKQMQDFSSGNGFYVSEKYKNAEKWSRAGRGGSPQAVIVFKIQQRLLSDENGKDLTPPRCEDEWGEIIKASRKDYPDARTEERLSRMSFIRGPMCSNPKDVAIRNVEPEGFHSGNIQLCVRENEYAKKFGSFENICCVIFY